MKIRTCKICGANEITTKWVTKHGISQGLVCRPCDTAKFKAWRQEQSSEKLNQIAERHAETTKIWNKENRERRNELTANWQEENRELVRQLSLQWAKDNPDKANARSGKRRAAKLQRTPLWLTKDELLLIEAKYAVAKWLSEVTQVAYHVDHTIPLQGELVSGLHVPSNLVVMRGVENLSKKNKYEVI